MNPRTLFENLPENPPPGYLRMCAKARHYLQVGPEIYRKDDALQQPPADLDSESLDLIRSGMQQILDGKGTTPETPFTDLDIHGFYLLLDTLHYKLHAQQLIGRTPGGMLDKMQMSHRVLPEITVLYNLVPIHTELP